MRIVSLIVTMCAVLGVMGCGNGGGNTKGTVGSDVEFDYAAMLSNYADNILIETYRDFELKSQEFSHVDSALNQYCVSMGSSAESSARDAAKTSWRELILAWQSVELLQLGPLAENNSALRNRIYAYGSGRSVSSCAIDEAVALNRENPVDVTTRSSNSRGLEAIEYLLFNEDLEHSCPSQIVATQTWNALSELEQKTARCQYASALADDIHVAAETVINAWEPGGTRNYRSVFLNPVNLNAQVAALSDALFYIESHVKDTKVGLPTGRHASCSDVACPELAEGQFSHESLAFIKLNLQMFMRVIEGGSGLGLDDLVVTRGYPSIIAQFEENVDLAISIIDASEDTLIEQSESIRTNGLTSVCENSAATPENAIGNIPICSLHGALKRITDILRSQFVTAINVGLPSRVEQDTD